MLLNEFLEKHIFPMEIKDSLKTLHRKKVIYNKRYCKGFVKGANGFCKFYKGIGVSNCSDKCRLRAIKRRCKVRASYAKKVI